MAVDESLYALVPKGLEENLRFRRELVKAGSKDRKTAHHIWMACARDPLFYINTFCWTHNPRKKGNTTLPMITYPFQDDMVREILSAIEDDEDFLVEKSRDMGASWICLCVFEWLWHFHDGKTFLCISSKEDLVDDKDNPNCLFWKIDFLLKTNHQPGWLRPNFNHTKLTFVNYDTGSTINGESTNSNAGRGGRNTAILLDEFAAVEEDVKVAAATRDNTDCRIFNSTPTYRGTNCEFYNLTQKEGLRRFKAHWTLHPDKAKGLYYDEQGKPHSPWYDKQCRRASSMAEIAIELDIDYKGAASGYFDSIVIDKLKRECQHPVMQGDPEFNLETGTFSVLANPQGSMRLWDAPTNTQRGERWPDTDEYTVGADISYGKGSTNSALSIVNRKTGVKVAEIVNSRVEPHEWAKLAVAVCKWFNNAFLVWEENGPGTIFRENVITLGYRNFFYRRNEKKLGKPDSDIPGWYNTPQTKRTLLSDYKKALAAGSFRNHSIEALKECLQYVFTAAGNIEHGGAINAIDPSGARENHGDRVIADALAWLGCNARPVREEAKATVEMPYLSWGWRQKEREKERRKGNRQWGTFAVGGAHG